MGVFELDSGLQQDRELNLEIGVDLSTFITDHTMGDGGGRAAIVHVRKRNPKKKPARAVGQQNKKIPG